MAGGCPRARTGPGMLNALGKCPVRFLSQLPPCGSHQQPTPPNPPLYPHPEAERAVPGCPRSSGTGKWARAATWRARGGLAAALCLQAPGLSHRPPQPRGGARRRPGRLQKINLSGSDSSSGGGRSLLLLHRHPCARPVPSSFSSSSRELSQRFAPPGRDWPAGRAASQWSRSEVASRAAPGLPAEPAAAAVARLQCGGRGRGPGRPERCAGRRIHRARELRACR